MDKFFKALKFNSFAGLYFMENSFHNIFVDNINLVTINRGKVQSRNIYKFNKSFGFLLKLIMDDKTQKILCFIHQLNIKSTRKHTLTNKQL